MARFTGRLAWVAVLVAGFAVVGRAQIRKKSNTAASARRVTLAQISEGKAQGVRTAPIEIEDFTDFQCPACRALYMQTLRPLIQKYVSTGKVYLVHHDFPLPEHPYSHKAAYYADAAAAIGRFGPVEDVLFTQQPKWAINGNILPVLATVLSPGQLREVEQLAKTPEVQDAVQRDFNLGMGLDVRETPTMFITYKGKRVPVIGVISFPVLQRYLDALLRQ